MLEHHKAWRERVSNTRVLLVLGASVLLLLALSVLVILLLLTLATTYSAITGDRWDGFVFTMYWIPGFFVYAFCVGFCKPLHAGARAAYDEAI